MEYYSGGNRPGFLSNVLSSVECKSSPTRASVYTRTLIVFSPQGVGECLRAETTDQYTAVA